MLIIDTECYSNYFLISFKNISKGTIKHFEIYPGKPLNKRSVGRIMSNNTTVSFNGLHYDLPMIAAALDGFDNAALKGMSDRIIKSGLASYIICRENHIDVPEWDHIDLFEVAPGRASLKIYGGRLHSKKMQGLPIAPDDEITPDQHALMRSYCENDLAVTQLLYEKLTPQIALRVSMSDEYSIDLRSKSDAQIAETIIKSELKKITGKNYKVPKLADDKTFRYRDPEIVSFASDELTDIFKKILKEKFGFAGNGSIKLPTWLKGTKIKIGAAQYQMGIGGLHSCEKSQCIAAGEGLLMDLDVTSYYPSIILQQELFPNGMGRDFLILYQSLVSRRVAAKKAGDMVTANTLKICLNGSFGKLGSKYSALYAPALLLQTTMTGQLALLMLIERVEAAGIAVRSANTDGIVCQCTVEQERLLEEVCWEWELDTTFALERSDYRMLASVNVNNYLAISLDGKAKGKGVFAKTGLMKNPDRAIVYQAVTEHLTNGISLRETIENCDDITQFVTIRRVGGGAAWRYIPLGSAIRFYSSTSVSFNEHITYEKNANRVPKSAGCKPLMDLPDTFPDDVDYNAYLNDAKKLLKEIGYA